MTSPRACPGAWTTRNPATSSPSLEHAVDLVRRALPDRLDHPVDRVIGMGLLHRPPSLHRVDVVGVAGEWHPERFAYVLCHPLVVGMDVGEGDHRDLGTTLELGEDPAAVPAPAGVDQHVLGQVDVDRRRRQLLEPPDPGRQALQCPPIPIVPRGSPLCLASSFELGDLALAFDAGRVAGRQRRDQALNPVADLKGEVRGDGAGKGADVLRGHLGGAAQQLRVLGLAHHLPPIFASSARASISACCPTSMRLLVSDHPDVVVEGARRVVRIARLDVEQVSAQGRAEAYRRRR